MNRAEALRLRTIIETAAASLDDKTASTAPTLFPRLRQDGSLIKAGTRINHNGSIKRAAVDLWDTADNSPDNAPTLWKIFSIVTDTALFPMLSRQEQHLHWMSLAGGAISCTSHCYQLMYTHRSSTQEDGSCKNKEMRK